MPSYATEAIRNKPRFTPGTPELAGEALKQDAESARNQLSQEYTQRDRGAGKTPTTSPDVPVRENERPTPDDSLAKAKVIKSKIEGKDIDGARVDLVESYLTMPRANFEKLGKELTAQTAGTSAPFKMKMDSKTGNLTDAYIENGQNDTFGRNDLLIAQNAEFKAPNTPLKNQKLEDIAVKYSNLMSDAHRPDSIGQALVKVAESLPKDEAKQLLDRVMEINVAEVAKQSFFKYCPCSHQPQSPEMKMEFSDRDKDGKAEELSGLKLSYSSWSILGVPFAHSFRGSVPLNFYTGSVDVFTPATKYQ